MRMNWKNTRVVVTGAGGFIGSHLAEALCLEGARVRALIHYNSRNHWGHLEAYSRRCPPNLEVVSGDVRDAFFMERLLAGQSFVFHLAALIPIPYSYVAPQSFVETNVLGTLNVLEACRKARVKRLIHTSTSEVYGTARYVPIDENHPLQAQSPYAASKIAADQLVESYRRSFGLPALTVRPFNTFGPRQSARALIPTLLSGLLADPSRLALGNTRPIRDFTFVEDTVRGFMAAAKAPLVDKVVNLGSGRGRSVREVLALCAKVAGVPVPRVKLDSRRVRPSPSEVWRLICDNRFARRVLGWKPIVPFEEGLSKTWEYMQQHKDEYKPHLYNL